MGHWLADDGVYGSLLRGVRQEIEIFQFSSDDCALAEHMRASVAFIFLQYNLENINAQ